MDSLTFISKIVEALAWPIVALSVLYWYFDPLRDLLGRLQNAKWKDYGLEFNERANALDAAVVESIPAPPEVSEREVQRLVSPINRLRQLAVISPNSAVHEAWRLVESAANCLLRKKGGSSGSKGVVKRLQELADSKAVEPVVVDAVRQLRELRNLAVHADVSMLDTDPFINVAVIVAGALEAAAEQPDVK